MGSEEENALLPMEHRSLELLDGESIYDMSAYKTVNERGGMSANILTSGVDYSKAAPSSSLIPFHPPDPNDSQWQFDTQADRGINDILKHVQANDIWTNLNNGFDGISNEIETSLKNNYELATFETSSLKGQIINGERVKTTSRPNHEETGFTPSKRISWPSSHASPAEPDPFVTVRSPLKDQPLKDQPLKEVKRPTWKTRRRKRLRRFKKPKRGELLRSNGVRQKKRRGHNGKRPKRPKQVFPRGDRHGLTWKRVRPQKLLHLSSSSVPVRYRSSGYLPGSTSRSSSTLQPSDASSSSLRPLVINGIFRVRTQHVYFLSLMKALVLHRPTLFLLARLYLLKILLSPGTNSSCHPWSGPVWESHEQRAIIRETVARCPRRLGPGGGNFQKRNSQLFEKNWWL